MILDHVAHRAGFFVVAASSLNAERLSDGDLHMIYVRVVPQGSNRMLAKRNAMRFCTDSLPR